MMLILGLIFIALPVLDIVSLIKAGDLWGFWPTVGAVFAAALLGATIVRHQGVSIGRQVQESLNAGRLPVIEAFDGACVLAAGALLLFPGLASDVVALALLLPPLRALLRRAIAWRLRLRGKVVVWRHGLPGGRTGGSSPRSGERGAVIDGEFEPVAPAPENDEVPRLPMPANRSRRAGDPEQG
jgi:UPF0716 protein FxsA